MSRVTALSRSGYLHHRLCHGLLIITVITPLPTKRKRDKNARELKAGERGNY